MHIPLSQMVYILVTTVSESMNLDHSHPGGLAFTSVLQIPEAGGQNLRHLCFSVYLTYADISSYINTVLKCFKFLVLLEYKVLAESRTLKSVLGVIQVVAFFH